MTFAWKTVKIGDIASPVDRTEPPIDGVIYRQVGVRLWGKGAYQREPIDGADTSYKSFNKTDINDIIVNKIWARNGSVSVINEHISGSYCSSEFPLFKLDTSKISPRWFFWITKCRWFWERCDKKSQGTSGKNRIKPKKFLEIDIPLPPIEEQNTLTSKFDSIQLKIDKATELREEILIEAQAMLSSTFAELIANSEYKSLQDVAPIVRRKVELSIDGEYPELGARSFGKGIFHKPTLFGAELEWQKLYKIHSGDLVISNIKAWEGAIAAAKPQDHGRVASHRYITCVAKKGVTNAQFLSFYLLSQEGIEKIRKASPGSADRNRTLAMKRLEVIEVPIPDYDKQLCFNKLQNKVDEIRKVQKENEIELEALMPSILDKAFKGELV